MNTIIKTLARCAAVAAFLFYFIAGCLQAASLPAAGGAGALLRAPFSCDDEAMDELPAVIADSDNDENVDAREGATSRATGHLTKWKEISDKDKDTITKIYNSLKVRCKNDYKTMNKEQLEDYARAWCKKHKSAMNVKFAVCAHHLRKFIEFSQERQLKKRLKAWQEAVSASLLSIPEDDEMVVEN